jgi:hypothetical protein
MNKAKIKRLLDKLGYTVWGIIKEGDKYRVLLDGSVLDDDRREMLLAEFAQYTMAEFEWNSELVVYK